MNVLTTKLSSRGQLVIPKQVRDAHRWSENTMFTVSEHAEGILLAPIATRKKTQPLSALVGALPKPRRKLSTRELCAPVADYAETTERD